MSITIKLLLSFITTTSPTTADIRDLCDIVDRETGIPLRCELHREGAPVFNGNVCCSATSCVPASSTCTAASLYFCELGEQHADGRVSCYVEVPSYCEVFACPSAPGGFQPQPIETAMCCSQGICWHTVSGSADCEFDDIYYCGSGVTNADGTVTCLDDE
jgi:Tfp pilus assembly protein PilW